MYFIDFMDVIHFIDFIHVMGSLWASSLLVYLFCLPYAGGSAKLLFRCPGSWWTYRSAEIAAWNVTRPVFQKSGVMQRACAAG